MSEEIKLFDTVTIKNLNFDMIVIVIDFAKPGLGIGNNDSIHVIWMDKEDHLQTAIFSRFQLKKSKIPYNNEETNIIITALSKYLRELYYSNTRIRKPSVEKIIEKVENLKSKLENKLKPYPSEE